MGGSAITGFVVADGIALQSNTSIKISSLCGLKHLKACSRFFSQFDFFKTDASAPFPG